MTNFDFKWLLPVVAPFAIYAYLTLFLAVAGVRLETESVGNIAIVGASLFTGLCYGGVALGHMHNDGVKWRWLARKDKPND
jgi:hypothetical protein